MNRQHLIIIAFCALVMNTCTIAQTIAPPNGVWKVVGVKNTILELGVAKPEMKDFVKTRKKYLGKSFTFSSKKIYFPVTLKNTSSYTDSAGLANTIRISRKKDTEQSLRYPGDELNCDSETINAGQCYVGNTFMKMLGSTATKLYVVNSESISTDRYTYKVCYWGGNQIGLLLENSNVLLLLRK